MPESPEVQTFRCNDCNGLWNVYVSIPPYWTPPDRADDRGVESRFCPHCSSRNLVFIEQTKTVSVYRCEDCKRTVAIPSQAKPDHR